MAPDFKTYLATQVLSEQQTVSYRNVSRALKVHVNSAKCMLYEFWEKENKKKAGSVYATYLVAGTRRKKETPTVTNGHADHTEDDQPMPSSPPPFTSSMLEPSQPSQRPEESENVPVKTICLVRQENMEATKQEFESITSIHIYSLSPGRLQDLVVLTDIGRGIFANTFAKEDPLTNYKTYGIIQNPGVRRRKGKRPVIPDTATRAPKPQPQLVKDAKPALSDVSKVSAAPATKFENNEISRPGSRDSTTSAASAKQPTLKRDGSNLFKAFAKAQNKPKLQRTDTDASTNASASGTEDVKMTDPEEEGESETEALFLDTGTRKSGSKKRPSEIKKEREDKHAKLRKVMDSDDEELKALPNVEAAAGTNEEPITAQNGGAQPEFTNDRDKDDEVAWSDSDTEKQRQTVPAKDSSTTDTPDNISTEPKRKRGKRKVMKKQTMKDDDGWLVTKEEAVWESFSEDDEPEPTPKEKPKTAFSSMKSQPGAGSQKSSAGAKGGTQKKKGDIMSFFGKK